MFLSSYCLFHIPRQSDIEASGMEDLVCLALNNSRQESTVPILRSIKYNRSEGSMQNYQCLKDNNSFDGMQTFAIIRVKKVFAATESFGAIY